MNNCYAMGFGLATLNQNNEIIEVYYPSPALFPSEEFCDDTLPIIGGFGTHLLTEIQQATLRESDDIELASLIESFSGSARKVVACAIKEDSAPSNVAEAFLKLHLISHRLVKPHGTNLTGVFGALKNLAWTNEGPIELDELPSRQLQARIEGRTLNVECVDRFPKMTDYVVPNGIRIADAARVRLGAYVGEGTTVMHEGFINFNAGTEGPAMIEGRISAGVWVGANSDLGGGSSTMGTLSGGGNIVISVGDNCLLGANAGTGIPLGNACTIESGLYITAGTKLSLLDSNGVTVKQVKAAELAGIDNLLFRRNSISGAVECLSNNTAIELNSQLHTN